MNSYNEENDITSRDIILIASMLSVVLLTLVGIVYSFDDTVCRNIWEMLSLDKIAECFSQLWRSML